MKEFHHQHEKIVTNKCLMKENCRKTHDILSHQNWIHLIYFTLTFHRLMCLTLFTIVQFIVVNGLWCTHIKIFHQSETYCKWTNVLCGMCGVWCVAYTTTSSSFISICLYFGLIMLENVGHKRAFHLHFCKRVHGKRNSDGNKRCLLWRFYYVKFVHPLRSIVCIIHALTAFISCWKQIQKPKNKRIL